MYKSTVLRCSETTAFFIFVTLGSLCAMAGCAQMYRAIGMNEEQVAAQVQKDQTVVTKILESARATTTEIVTTVLAGLGAIASGFLAKWLGTERKITKALITGVESAQGGSAKSSIKKTAMQIGVESKLHKRVQALT